MQAAEHETGDSAGIRAQRQIGQPRRSGECILMFAENFLDLFDRCGEDDDVLAQRRRSSFGRVAQGLRGLPNVVEDRVVDRVGQRLINQ